LMIREANKLENPVSDLVEAPSPQAGMLARHNI